MTMSSRIVYEEEAGESHAKLVCLLFFFQWLWRFVRVGTKRGGFGVLGASLWSL